MYSIAKVPAIKHYRDKNYEQKVRMTFHIRIKIDTLVDGRIQ